VEVEVDLVAKVEANARAAMWAEEQLMAMCHCHGRRGGVGGTGMVQLLAKEVGVSSWLQANCCALME